MSHHPSFLAIYMLTCATFISIVIFSVTFFYLRGYLRIKKFAENNPVYANQDGTVARPKYVKRLHNTIILLLCSLFISFFPMLISMCVISIYMLADLNLCSQLLYIGNYVTNILLILDRISGPIIILSCNSKARFWIRKRIVCSKV